MSKTRLRSSPIKDLDAAAGTLVGTEIVPIEIPGVGDQQTTTQAIANLGGGGGGLSNPVTIAQGGTGQTSAAAALNALGGIGAAAAWNVLVPTAVKTTTYTAAAYDLVRCDTTSGAFTVTLPTAPADKTLIGVRVVTFGAGHNLTIATGGSDVFEVTGGATTSTLSGLQMKLYQYIATGAIWIGLSIAGVTPPANGGTGLATLTAHGVLVGEGTGNVALVGPGSTSGVPLIAQGASSDPAFGTAVVAGGGTGLASLTAHAVVVGEGTSNVALVGPGTAGQALTSVGAAVDPAYVTAAPSPLLGPTGAVAETMPRSVSSGTVTVGSTGVPTMFLVGLVKGQVVTNITFASRNTAANTPSHWGFFLADSSRNVLAVTADQLTTAWNSTTAVTLAVATDASNNPISNFTILTSGVYYIGFWMVATGLPNFSGNPSATQVLQSLAPISSGTSSTGSITTPASLTAASPLGALTAHDPIYGVIT